MIQSRLALWSVVCGLWSVVSCTTLDVNKLSTEEKVGQLLVPAVTGMFMNERSPAFQRAVYEVRDHHVGGLLLNISDVYETAWLVGRLQQKARVPLLISADLEAGIGMRFNDTTYWPWAMAIAATGDPAYAEKLGRVVAREARAMGVNHIFAPVADVNNNPDNPVINVRSFGEDPETVSKFVAAFIRGVQSEGVLATAKHFPGHGDTAADSHRSLPILDVPRERLDQLELIPFRAAIDAGVASVMVAHIALPQIDASPLPQREVALENVYSTDQGEMAAGGTMPSSLSPAIIDILRKDLAFDRLVVTDAIEMGALSDHFEPGEAAVRAVVAGADQVAKPYETDEVFNALVAAVKSGRITRPRLDEAVSRVLSAKRRIPTRPARMGTIFREVDTPEHRALAEEIAQKAITLVRLEEGVLPLKRDARVAVLVIGDRPEATAPLREFESHLRARLGIRPMIATIDRMTPPDEIQRLTSATATADVVIAAFTVRTRSGAGASAIPDHAKNLLAAIEARGQETIAISFGNPYLLREVPSMKTYIAAYGVQPVMQSAATKALFGEAAIGGKLPVSIPGLYPRNHGLEIRNQGSRIGGIVRE